METKYYLRIENEVFCFVVEGIHVINPKIDHLITKEDYDRFFDLQSHGKQFRLKAEPTGESLFDLVEEHTPEPIPVPPSETDLLKERVDSLEKENADLLLDSATKDLRIGQTEQDVADLLLVIGGAK